MKDQIKRLRAAEDGFTLIELLIAIVVVGILAAVVVVGIGSLTNSGEDAACEASLDSAEAASVVYYANNNAWPPSLVAMDGDELQTETGVVVAGNTATATGWTLTMTPVAGAAPTFACT